MSHDDELLRRLTRLCEDLAWDRPADEELLYSLTDPGGVPPELAALAEAFGLMLVKLEARKMHQESLITDLSARNLELDEARAELARRNVALSLAVEETFHSRRLVGQCPAIRQVADLALSIAKRPINTMILGPTGSGKEVVAKMIHYNSPRRENNFVAVNCTAIPETLFESEMFGIEKGVATGVAQRRGLVEEADGGTLFLDEVADMSLTNQAKLLRVLEEREIRRVGAAKDKPVDLMVISAANIDLNKAVAEKKFREDLFYRLNVAEVRLPPLAERGEDVLLLAANFLESHARRLGRTGLSLTRAAQTALLAYGWPGNVRELNNEMERAAALTVGEAIEPEDLSLKIRAAALEVAPAPAAGRLADMEKRTVEAALARHGGNKSRAAKELGLSREGLRKKMKKLWPES
ncbi:sigma-54-dependent Fis family transcriptional regulator [Deltaproteobacteria bacterium Smac51]|nr:sigma-54-dependent Fis family transcriptional regulator [Deltaproteobacteria bacterium Smac51]